MLLHCGRGGVARASICGVWTAATVAAAVAVSLSFSAETSAPSFLTFPPPHSRPSSLASRFLAQHRAALAARSLRHQQQLQQQQPQQQQQGSPVSAFLASVGAGQSGVQRQGPPALSFSSLPRGPPSSRAPGDPTGAPVGAAEGASPQQYPAATMAWHSHGRTNKELVENLRRAGVFTDQRVYETMVQVDRGYFVKEDPYLDMPQSIGFGATISAPHMHAIALQQLKDELKWGNRALDVGSGTGYLTVCMGLMVGAGEEGGGIAIGMDYIQGLVDLSRRNVAAGYPQLLQSKNFELIKGDGWAGGPSWGAPYDAIHVGAAAAAVPAALLQQLAPGGKMVIPVECKRGRITLEGLGEREIGGELGGGQALVAVNKNEEGTVSVKYVTSVVYVPLVRTS
ncbi:protein-l-isoaspartate o-methyltransferase, putative [Eimeria mitis]|uniref:protein-L-isoaspartate(D-aspartate) O-methyltransferase n=1 Tax=Eimeria mitis TaxID=44415 RepID=U6JXX7_9EIME|nr:protein-l-isoaspartate o-methyltransferase, putative [Eimeria mitis]CDJ28353.1 protein-l-isoaspartate o-methyltransferase, putative [Eimeria mitis]